MRKSNCAGRRDTDKTSHKVNRDAIPPPPPPPAPSHAASVRCHIHSALSDTFLLPMMPRHTLLLLLDYPITESPSPTDSIQSPVTPLFQIPPQKQRPIQNRSPLTQTLQTSSGGNLNLTEDAFSYLSERYPSFLWSALPPDYK